MDNLPNLNDSPPNANKNRTDKDIDIIRSFYFWILYNREREIQASDWLFCTYIIIKANILFTLTTDWKWYNKAYNELTV